MEILLDDFTSINISENTDLLPVLVSLELNQLLSEEDLDTSLMALIKSNLVSIRELEDLLVGSPVLKSCTGGSSLMEFVLSKEMLVIECEKGGAFLSVRECGVVDEEISVSVMETVIVVVIENSSLLIDDMSPHLLLSSVSLEVRESFNGVIFLLKT